MCSSDLSGETAIDISTARCVPYDNILLGGDLNIIRLHQNDGRFLSYQLNGVRKLDIARVAQGSSVIHLYGESIKSISVSIPTLNEQQKIVSLLSLIDERIATQNKIIEDLKLSRDAIVEKLFCDYGALKPKLRLSKFSNNWKEVKLKDICDRIKSKNDNQNNTNVLTISALYGIVSQESYFNKSVASLNLSNYYLLQNGDFAYNKSYSKDYAWGAIKRLIKYKEGVLSPLYICFRPNKSIDSDFLSHYFESAKWHKVISDIAGEGARNHGLLNISIID